MPSPCQPADFEPNCETATQIRLTLRECRRAHMRLGGPSSGERPSVQSFAESREEVLYIPSTLARPSVDRFHQFVRGVGLRDRTLRGCLRGEDEVTSLCQNASSGSLRAVTVWTSTKNFSSYMG